MDTLKTTLPGARWYAAGTLHVTAAFLGEQPPSAPDRLRELAALAEAEAPAPARAALEGLGAFPSWDRPRVIWAGVGEGAAAMRAHEAALRPRLKAAGFTVEEREFTPHCTLGRVKAGARPPAPPVWSSPSFPCGPLRLYESRLTPAGAVHAELPA